MWPRAKPIRPDDNKWGRARARSPLTEEPTMTNDMPALSGRDVIDVRTGMMSLV